MHCSGTSFHLSVFETPFTPLQTVRAVGHSVTVYPALMSRPMRRISCDFSLVMEFKSAVEVSAQSTERISSDPRCSNRILYTEHMLAEVCLIQELP